MNKGRKFFALGIALVVLNACATDASTPETSSAQPSPRANDPGVVSTNLSQNGAAPSSAAALASTSATSDQLEYQRIHNLYSAQVYDQALAQMEGFETRHPGSPLIADVENLRGLCLLLSHRPTDAISHFQNAIRLSTNPAVLPYLNYNLARSQVDSGDFASADRVSSQIDPEKLDLQNRIKFHFLRADIDSRQKDGVQATREALLASLLANPLTPELRTKMESSMDTSIPLVSSASPIEDLYHDFQNSPVADALLFRLSSKEMNLGLEGKAEDHLQTLITRFPQSPYAAQASSQLKTWQNQAVIDRKAIGVLLPLKGRFAPFGQRNLQAIEQAFGIFDPPGTDSGYTLVIQDSGEDADQAIRGLNDLVLRQHVSVVIGPLLSKGIDQITKRAEELGVPLFSLARYAGATENYVIQSGLTLQAQAYEIAKFAIQNRGLRRFAILYPKDQAGEESSQAFWDAVESMGGQIVGVESYTPNETDFRQPVDKLSGLYYTEARQRELDELAKQRKENNIKRRTRKTEQYFSLTPIVDYEAVFIPDEPKVTGQIMPTFAYRDVDHVQFLGTSTWSSADLIARAQNYAEGALFVDAFFQGSQDPNVRKFVDEYQSQFGATPSTMSALAYDAALVARNALDNAGSSFSRADLLNKIRHSDSIDGVTGKVSYKDGQLTRDLRVLSIQGGQIVEERR